MDKTQQQYQDVIGLGVAGNFVGHLEQAGEAIDFVSIKTEEAVQPKGIFPFYLPYHKNQNNKHFLNTFPLSTTQIKFPKTLIQNFEQAYLQIEPEVALLCDIHYNKNHEVIALKPNAFAAYNDCSIRRPNAKKISEKKNWGEHSKGISETLITLEGLYEGCLLDQFRIASFHIHKGQLASYGEDSAAIHYSYFHEKLLHWIVDRMNHQQDIGPTEHIAQLLKQSNYPQRALISIGATRYTPYGSSHFLQPGDLSIVVVYDSLLYHFEQIQLMATTQQFATIGLSALVQSVDL